MSATQRNHIPVLIVIVLAVGILVIAFAFVLRPTVTPTAIPTPTVVPTEIPTVDVKSCDRQAVTIWTNAIIMNLSGFRNVFSWGEGATSIPGKLMVVKEMQIQMGNLVAPGCMSIAHTHAVVAITLSRKGLETLLAGDLDAGYNQLNESATEVNAVYTEIDRVKAEKGLK